MSTHTSEHRTALDFDDICDLVETHGATVAMALLWAIPVLALLVAVPYT